MFSGSSTARERDLDKGSPNAASRTRPTKGNEYRETETIDPGSVKSALSSKSSRVVSQDAPARGSALSRPEVWLTSCASVTRPSRGERPGRYVLIGASASSAPASEIRSAATATSTSVSTGRANRCEGVNDTVEFSRGCPNASMN